MKESGIVARAEFLNLRRFVKNKIALSRGLATLFLKFV
jgi:hypothetical protein